MTVDRDPAHEADMAQLRREQLRADVSAEEANEALQQREAAVSGYFDDDQAGDGCPECGQIWDVCECHVGEECGRWRNARLDSSCTKAGSEECDFECPYRNSLKF